MYTLLSGPMVYTLFPCFPRKRVYTIAFFFCSATMGSGDRPRKEGFDGGGVYSFFPCTIRPAQTPLSWLCRHLFLSEKGPRCSKNGAW